MTWSIGDFGFEMTLSPRVPDLLRDRLRAWLAGFIASYGLRVGDIAGWAVHPGGPRVLGAVAEALELPAGALDASRTVLAECGNMSSPTVLFILQELARRGGGGLARPCICLAFGPGLVAEAALLR